MEQAEACPHLLDSASLRCLQDPTGFLLLFRALARAVATGKRDLLCSAFAAGQLLHPLLATLQAIHKGPRGSTPQLQPLVVELLLRLPVRLADLLPVVPQLMRPLLIALQVYMLWFACTLLCCTQICCTCTAEIMFLAFQICLENWTSCAGVCPDVCTCTCVDSRCDACLDVCLGREMMRSWALG